MSFAVPRIVSVISREYPESLSDLSLFTGEFECAAAKGERHRVKLQVLPPLCTRSGKHGEVNGRNVTA